MKKIISIIGCSVLMGSLLQAAVITTTDEMESGTGWSSIGAGFSGFKTETNGLSPNAGSEFVYMFNSANNVNGSIYKNLGITLAAGTTYRIEVAVGKATGDAFMPTSASNPFHSYLSFGFFTNSVSAGADVRNAIQSFGGNADLTVENFSLTVPVDGTWEIWSYDLVVASGSSLDGVAVNFGIGWNTGDGSFFTGRRGIAFDNVTITAIPEPTTIHLFLISFIGAFFSRGLFI